MTDLLTLLPPSIAGDAKMSAAAESAGQQEAQVRALVNNILLWPRVDTLSEGILNHLGWGLHVDGWEYADSIQKKRWLIKNFYGWHSLKGTEAGLEQFWRVLLDRSLFKATAPHKVFMGGSLSQAEREAFEAPHPEIRVYPFRHSRVKKGFMLGGCLGDPAEGWPAFPLMTDALLRIGSKVVLFDPLDQSSTDLHSMLYETDQVERMAHSVIEVRKPGKRAGVFCGACLAGHLVDHNAKSRLYTLQLAQPYQTEIERRTPLAIQPSLEPLNVYYRERNEAGAARGMFLANRYADQYPNTGGKAHLGADIPAKSNAADRVFKYLKLFDPSRLSPARRNSHLYLGGFRLGGMPAHTADVAVDVTGWGPRRGLHPGSFTFTGVDFPYISDAKTRISQVRQVGKLAKRASDKILLSISNHKPVKASPSVLAGTVTAGEYRLEVI